MTEWDKAARRAARGRGALELAIGETLLRLFEGDRLLQLGHARRADYARERMGVTAKTMYTWARLARGLAERPLLRRAVVSGAVSARKAITVFAAARDEAEAEWTAAAMKLPLKELQRRVREKGHDPCADTFEVESIVFRMTEPEQDRLDAALELAKVVVGPATPRWQRLEAMCQEFLGEFGAVDATAFAVVPVEARGVERPRVERELPPVDEEPVAELPDDAVGLDRRIMALMRERVGREEALGRVLEEIARLKLWRSLGYANFEEYCVERLGVSGRRARERIWLERRMCALPELREALVAGRLSLLKASAIAADATPFNVVERIEEAARTTYQQTEEESTKEEDRRNRTLGVRRLWGPKDAAETIIGAIAAVQADAWVRCRVEMGAGEALARIADHFRAVWTYHIELSGQRPRKSAVFDRTGGICAMPGCTRAADHEHHIVFRSHGGSDEGGNKVGLCAAHHLRGVHHGYLKVEGNADRALVWTVGATGHVWITDGGDTLLTNPDVAGGYAGAHDSPTDDAAARADSRRRLQRDRERPREVAAGRRRGVPADHRGRRGRPRDRVPAGPEGGQA